MINFAWPQHLQQQQGMPIQNTVIKVIYGSILFLNIDIFIMFKKTNKN